MCRNVLFEFHILVGLPGSGKSYWAEHNFPKPPYNYRHNGKLIVDLDSHKNDVKGNWIYNALNDEFINYMKEFHYDKVEVCIDGPISCYKHLYTVIETVMKYINVKCEWKGKYANYKVSFIIHQWDKDIDTCIYNDKVRNRAESASFSIKNLEYEDIDIKEVKKYLKTLYSVEENEVIPPEENKEIGSIKKIGHMVKKTTTFEQIFEPFCYKPYGIYDTSDGYYLYSKDWSLGGEWGNCWGDHGNVSPETPKEFVELDDFLEKVAPNISFLQYKKIKNHCIEQIEWHEHDYYSSGTYSACWRCDMKKLYELLKEMNYINDYE